MKKITIEMFQALTEALSKEILSGIYFELEKSKQEEYWIELYFIKGFSEIKTLRLSKICEKLNLGFHFMPDPNYILIYVTPNPVS